MERVFPHSLPKRYLKPLVIRQGFIVDPQILCGWIRFRFYETRWVGIGLTETRSVYQVGLQQFAERQIHCMFHSVGALVVNRFI